MKMNEIALCLMLLFTTMLNGCGGDDSDGDQAMNDYSGTYKVTLTEAGFSEERIWELSQSGSQVVIKDNKLLITFSGTVSGNTVTIPSSSVTVGGETFTLSMSLVFDESGTTFAGTETTTMDGVSVTVAVNGAKI